MFLVNIIKKNAARTGVLFCAVLVSFLNAKSQNKKLFEESFLKEKGILTTQHQKIEQPTSLALAPIAEAHEMIDYERFLKEEGEKNTVLGSLMPVTNPTPEEFGSSGQDVFVYKVKDGDTIGSIALKYSVTANTLLWANDLADNSVIKPGDEIFILPITGIKHRVESGDTVKSLAKKYKTNEQKIISFNNLPADGEMKKGEEIIIPDGERDDQSRYRNAEADLYAKLTGKTLDAPVASVENSKKLYQYPAHKFPYGWCTWYVATRRHVPWGGNAGTWIYHAKSYGAQTGRSPRVGAIMVTGESRWGHVAIVEKVKDGNITVSEMNYKGWGVKSQRTLSSSSSVIKGFIY